MHAPSGMYVYEYEDYNPGKTLGEGWKCPPALWWWMGTFAIQSLVPAGSSLLVHVRSLPISTHTEKWRPIQHTCTVQCSQLRSRNHASTSFSVRVGSSTVPVAGFRRLPVHRKGSSIMMDCGIFSVFAGTGLLFTGYFQTYEDMKEVLINLA
jgi:hypothetical protein